MQFHQLQVAKRSRTLGSKALPTRSPITVANNVYYYSRSHDRLPYSRRLGIARAAIPATEVPRSLAQVEAGEWPLYWGPIEVVDTPGKGRGVVATRDVAAGELLLVCPPLAYATAPEGEIPEHDELAEQLRSCAFGPLQRQALLSLYNGEDTLAPLPRVQDLLAEQHAVRRRLSRPGAKAHHDGAAGSDSDGPAAESRVSEDELNDEQLYGILACNCFGEEFHDMPLSGYMNTHATSAQARPESWADGGGVGHLGLWPAFSLLNHSCLPSAVNYVVGDLMVVHAGRHVSKGQEVCINYLGRGALRPVAERQADTASGYGFSCACPRCNFEQTYGAGVSQTLQGMSDQLGAKLGPQLNEAASSGDMAGVQQVKEQVTQLLVQLEAAITVAQQPAGAADGSSSGVHAFTAEQRTWLLASAFDMYALQGVACEVLGQEKEALESLSRQADLVQRVAPASDLHLYLSVKRLALAQKLAATGSSSIPADVSSHASLMASCLDAVRRRYGALLAPQSAQQGLGADGDASALSPGALRTAEALVQQAAIALERIML